MTSLSWPIQASELEGNMIGSHGEASSTISSTISGISNFNTVQTTQKQEDHTFNDQEFISIIMNTANIT